MNPIFVFLVIVGSVFLWLLCSFLYRPIGRFCARLFNDAKREMFETDNETQNEKENIK